MVQAEAVAQPLPGESATVASSRGPPDPGTRRPPAPPADSRLSPEKGCLPREGRRRRGGETRNGRRPIARPPDGAFDHFLTGLEQYKRGYMTQAKRHFALALRAQPNHFWAQCLLAICDLNTRPAHAEGAKAYLTACLQTHPELPWLYLLRGFASGQIGSRASSPVEAAENFAAAEADYREALRRDSGGRFRYALLVNRGLVRLQSRKLDEAIADLEEAIALDPRQLSAYVTLAQIHRQRHQIDLALEELGRAIALQAKPGPALPDPSSLEPGAPSA